MSNIKINILKITAPKILYLIDFARTCYYKENPQMHFFLINIFTGNRISITGRPLIYKFITSCLRIVNRIKIKLPKNFIDSFFAAVYNSLHV